MLKVDCFRCSMCRFWVLHACTTLQAVLNYVMRCCRLKCLSMQHELHNELKVLRCEKYVQDAMNAIEADAEQQVGC